MNTAGSSKFIAYYRVSTARQGRSGLGLEAQRSAVRAHLGSAALIGEYVEVESGRRNDRPKLTEALSACRVHNSVLVIAKLDRLARNVAFVSNLMEAGVEFEAVDFPQANRLTVHILAAVAEHEARLISERTRAALSAAKARGATLGGFKGRAGTKADCARARAARVHQANRRSADLMPIINTIRASGARSLRAIARSLNAQAILAPRGGLWSAAQVQRTLQRVSAS